METLVPEATIEMNDLLLDGGDALPNEGVYWRPFGDYGFTSPWAPRLWLSSTSLDYLYSATISFFTVVVFALLYPACRHWFIIPLFVCGILSGTGIVAWLRKEIDIFDSRAIVSGYLFLNCFLTPFFHIAYNVYGYKLDIPDPPTWFGRMAFFNIGGLVLYKIAQNLFFKRTSPVRSFWKLEAGRFIGTLTPLIFISLAAFCVTQIVFGGLTEEVGKIEISAGAAAFSSLISVLLMFGDPLLILIMMLVISYISGRAAGKSVSIWIVAFILIVALIFQMLSVGERASRLAIISILLIITGTIHYRLRPFSLKVVLLGICMVFVFSHLYDYRKKFGKRGWEAFYSAQARESMAYEAELSGTIGTLTGTFSRASVHAFLLYRLMEFPESYEPIWGKSYLMAAMRFVPRAIWKTKGKNPKVEAAGKILGYSPLLDPTRQYGIAGEAMLNFSYYGIMPAFFIFGGFLGWYRKKVVTLEPTDSRFFIVPICYLVIALTVNMDSDNAMFNSLKLLTLPFIGVLMASIKTKLGGDEDYEY